MQVVRWGGLALALLAGSIGGAFAADPLAVRITYVTHEEPDRLPPLSLVEPREIPDEGLAGARLGISDNATTGRFLGHEYQLDEIRVPVDDDLAAAVAEALADGARLIVADLVGEDLVPLMEMAGEAGALVFNARAEDDALRTEVCHEAAFHVIPSRAMKADGLAQYLMWKQWPEWLLVHGTREADLLFADAIRRAATKFGAEIVEERAYEYQATARRTDTGHVQVQRQLPVFTQDAEEHDVLVVADESDVFGEYLPYRTWDPRPVVGTQGLVPVAWSRAFEAWGGTQMQNRFESAAGRPMRERDYAAWLAVRTIGEAVTRTSSAAADAIRDYLRSDAFEIGAFKGEGLTFRTWNQQMRQPILLTTPRMLVSVSPQEGYLHQRTPLDTLGYDQPESDCDLS